MYKSYMYVRKCTNRMKTLSLITLSFVLILFFSSGSYAQREISGKVLSETGKALPNFVVKLKNKEVSTLSDSSGFYKMWFPNNSTNIEFSDYSGYSVKTLNYLSDNVINIIYSPLSKNELINLDVFSASLKKEDIDFAPSNITVITKKMIEDRAYQTLIEICEDLPGFDFLIFEDGGGEYPTYNMNRGVGTIGNTKILVMVDGIVQNNISFNWSLLWTFENLLNDIERIELIEGPGSSVYGAQAFTGVIHFITSKDFHGIEIKPFFGSNMTYGGEFLFGYNFKNNTNFTLAVNKYNSDGDGGDRYDPGNYFHNHLYPDTIMQNYDENGNYVTNIPNPIGGQKIPAGFNNFNNSISVRTKLRIKNTEIGGFFWNYKRGSSSYINGYEYNVTHDEHQTSSRGYHIYTKNSAKFSKKIFLQSNIVFRATHILPKTGLRYNYRFTEMTKNYVSYAFQGYIEERLLYILSEKTNFILGVKGMSSAKTQRIISINSFPDQTTSTESSWNIASKGNGLGVSENYSFFLVNETAVYGLWDNHWNKKISTSFGIRYDYSSEHGGTTNPRLALIIKPANLFGAKLLYGTAFRQPSLFELNSEFRGNPNLTSEKISTYELELNSLVLNDQIKMRTNMFYSKMVDFIGKVPDVTKPSGERYENTDKLYVIGLSFDAVYIINKNISIFSNYMFLTGKTADSLSWNQIERTAQHKVNGGINIRLFKEKLNVNCRINYVAKRKAQSTNDWLQKYENGYAPAYKKINFVVSYKFLKRFRIQLKVKNLLNEQFYGIARETGSGLSEEYNYQTNSNPEGFIGSYHPQPGRTFLFSLGCKF